LKINQAGIDLIKKWEGLRRSAYQDAVGIWTIGYGHTSKAGPPEVKPGMVIEEQTADEILRRDISKFEQAVFKCVTYPVNENQFSACVSLCFNIGPSNFRKSLLVRRLNEGNIEAAANAFLSWRKAGGLILSGLIARRKEERELFLKEVNYV
jgi:lysozyme